MTKRVLFCLALAFGLLVGNVFTAQASESGGELMAAHTNVRDKASLQRGARLFFNYCVGCHSLQYLRYSRMAKDLGLTQKEVTENLDFTGAKFQDAIVASMPAADATKWFGKVPPDLSLEIDAKGTDWVYSYLNSFYLDPARPVGWNNTVFPNASMPFPLWELQGVQVAKMSTPKDGDPAQVEKLVLKQPGSMTPAQYHAATRDLTAFLQYAAEPVALQRHSMGVWVILFLAIFTFLAYLLKHEYWKDVH